MALRGAGPTDAEGIESFDGRMRDELLDETLFLSLALACIVNRPGFAGDHWL